MNIVILREKGHKTIKWTLSNNDEKIGCPQTRTIL